MEASAMVFDSPVDPDMGSDSCAGMGDILSCCVGMGDVLSWCAGVRDL